MIRAKRPYSKGGKRGLFRNSEFKANVFSNTIYFSAAHGTGCHFFQDGNEAR
ncbi:MAG: hypothetical protein PWP51_1373 [Clostridiales bacterium]|nr:hypothetical protein [Clostridiales bacterium]MDN5298820.1 hypothetical protein [Clostridiales bacterium]